VANQNDAFTPVFYHRLKYFLTPQFDLYQNIAQQFVSKLVRPNLLDYGCGTGVGTLLLVQPGYQASYPRVRGIDCDPQAIAFAQSLAGHLISFYDDDWQTQPLAQKAMADYDLITCIEVVEHVADPDTLLKNFAARLIPTGVLIISTVNHNSQYRKNKAHVSKFRIADFRALLSKHFATIRITDYTLENDLADDSSVTPMVGICKRR